MNRLRKSVLIVEDEVEIAEFMSDEFYEQGFQVIRTDNLKDAIFKASNQKFDLVLLDIKLKSGSGDEFVKVVKSDNKHLNYESPIVVTSAWLTKDLISHVGTEIDYAFVKPFHVDNVITKCIEIMKSKDSSE